MACYDALWRPLYGEMTRVRVRSGRLHPSSSNGRGTRRRARRRSCALPVDDAGRRARDRAAAAAAAGRLAARARERHDGGRAQQARERRVGLELDARHASIFTPLSTAIVTSPTGQARGKQHTHDPPTWTPVTPPESDAAPAARASSVSARASARASGGFFPDARRCPTCVASRASRARERFRRRGVGRAPRAGAMVGGCVAGSRAAARRSTPSPGDGERAPATTRDDASIGRCVRGDHVGRCVRDDASIGRCGAGGPRWTVRV